MKERLERLLSRARRGSYWMALLGATAVVVGVSVMVGSSALDRARAWRSRTADVRATQSMLATWRRELVPPTPAESAAWRSSERAVRERGIDASDRLALLQLVAQRAEDLGIAGVDVNFISADTLDIPIGREVEDEVFDVAPYALSVRFVGDYDDVARFVGSLPPQVEVHQLGLAAGEEGVGARLLLAVFLGIDG